MDKIVETYNPYTQKVEQQTKGVPDYIQATYINSTEIRSPFIAGNNGYIGGTLRVGATGIFIDGVNRLIRSSNYVRGSAGWQIDNTGRAEFQNIVARGDIVASSASFGYAASDTRGGTISKGFTSDDLSRDTSGISDGVRIDNRGIYLLSGGDVKVSIRSDGNATFAGTIYAQSGEFSGDITSTATITGGIIEGATIQTASSGKRVKLLPSNNIEFYSNTGLVATLDAEDAYVRGQERLVVSGTLGITGLLSVNMTSYLTSIIPQTNRSYDIGTTGFEYRNIYAGELYHRTTGSTSSIDLNGHTTTSGFIPIKVWNGSSYVQRYLQLYN